MIDNRDEISLEGHPSGSDIYVHAAGAAARHTEDGAVVIGLRASRVLRLNPTGSLVWQVLGDGVTVAQLADEFADAFAVPRDVMLGDLVPMLVSLANDGLLDEVSRGAPPSPHDASQLDVADDGRVRLSYPPCGCLRTVEDIEWAAMFAVGVGNEIFTVRTNDLGAHELLSAALGAHVIDDPLAKGYYSVELSAEPTPEAPLRLWEGNTVICQTTSTAVLWERLYTAVSGHLPAEPGTVPLSMFTAVGPRGATLVPVFAAESVYERRNELAAAGILLADGPSAVDPDTGDAVISGGVEVDEGAAASFASLLPGRAPVAGAAPGRAAVVALATGGGEPDDELTRLRDVAAVIVSQLRADPTLDANRVFDAIDALARTPYVEPPATFDAYVPWMLDVLA